MDKILREKYGILAVPHAVHTGLSAHCKGSSLSQ